MGYKGNRCIYCIWSDRLMQQKVQSLAPQVLGGHPHGTSKVPVNKDGDSVLNPREELIMNPSLRPCLVSQAL